FTTGVDLDTRIVAAVTAAGARQRGAAERQRAVDDDAAGGKAVVEILDGKAGRRRHIHGASDGQVLGVADEHAHAVADVERGIGLHGKRAGEDVTQVGRRYRADLAQRRRLAARQAVVGIDVDVLEALVVAQQRNVHGRHRQRGRERVVAQIRAGQLAAGSQHQVVPREGAVAGAQFTTGVDLDTRIVAAVTAAGARQRGAAERQRAVDDDAAG